MIYRVMTRTLVAALGICAIGWALEVIPVYRASSPIIEVSERILAGDDFTSAQLDAMRRDLVVAPGEPLLASAESGTVTIGLRRFEDQLKQEAPKAAAQGVVLTDVDELHSRALSALALAPTDSFMWLSLFWLSQHGEFVRNDLDLLRMSYSTGKNEGWIAVRRSPLALGMLGKLPDGLASQALGEFVRLLQSGLYTVAANILAGPAWPVRDRLLQQLGAVDEVDRNAFAKAIDAKDLPGIEIPLPETRPNRPF